MDAIALPPAVVPLLAVIVLLALHGVLSALLVGILARAGASGLSAATAAARRPLFFAMVPLGLLLSLPALRPNPAADAVATRVFGILLALALAWALVRMTTAAFDVVMRGPALVRADSIETRRRITLLTLVRRLVILAIGLVALGLVLTAIPGVRQIGLSLFASAGVAGIIVGLAAQPTISNLIAGIQIAVTQPIRIGDRVIVENEFGEVRQINATYVVLALWDQRQLILPLSYFLQKPFQNWTHASSELLKSFFLYLDYGVPVDAVRDRLHALVKDNPLWDGRVSNLQVTDFKETTVELRVLVSAADAASGWDLACQIREGLLSFIYETCPEALPRRRQSLVETRQAPEAGRPHPSTSAG